jgi:multiple antibiotic resistance protein
VIGLLPVYLDLTKGLREAERRRVAIEATFTAAGVGLGFLVVGDFVLHVLGVSVGDFQVSGGIGVVPLGTPIIVGPAVLTALLALARSQGYPVTILAFGLNLIIVSFALCWASLIERTIGEAGARAVAKVASLLLAGIAVSMIRTGVTGALREVAS